MSDDLQWLAAVTSLAVTADLLLGDPPNRWHPVAWMGRLLAWGRGFECGSSRVLLARGAALVLVTAGVAGIVGWSLSSAVRQWGWPGVILEAIALKIVISLRGLIVSCRQVARALERGDLVEARRLVGYHLVGRPTSSLDAPLVASAVIESAAENLTDAFIAPLACYLVVGLAGAYAYRAVNTADAMIGYRGGALEYFGKASARLDDLLNLLPARLAALAIVVSAGLIGEDARGAWRAMVRDHGRTASPNAGWTMSAMAGALGVTLEKAGAYRLGTGTIPQAGDVARGIRVVVGAALGTVVTLVGLLLLRIYSR